MSEAILTNSHHSPSASMTVRATKQEVRSVAFFKHWSGVYRDPREGVKGEVTHIEALGSIYFTIAHRLDGAQCGSLPPHEHCTTDMPDHQHFGAACCLIPEPFPVSLYLDVPPGYALSVPLGDELRLTVSR